MTAAIGKIERGGNVQILARNTSAYGANLETVSREVGYDGGTLRAQVSVASGYVVKSCEAYGNVKDTSGNEGNRYATTYR